MTDFSALEKWMETTYLFEFNQLKSRKEFEEKKEEILADHKLTKYGVTIQKITGRDPKKPWSPTRGGQIAIGRYFTGNRDNPLSNTKAAQIWEDLLEKEKTAVEEERRIRTAALEKISTISNKIGTPLPEGIGRLNAGEMGEVLQDFEKRQTEFNRATKILGGDRVEYKNELRSRIPTITTPEEFRGLLKTLTEDVRPLQQKERESYRNLLLTKAQTLPFDSNQLTQLRLQTARSVSSAQNIDYRRERAYETLRTKTTEELLKTKKGYLKALEITPTEINTIRNGRLPESLAAQFHKEIKTEKSKITLEEPEGEL